LNQITLELAAFISNLKSQITRPKEEITNHKSQNPNKYKSQMIPGIWFLVFIFWFLLLGSWNFIKKLPYATPWN
jgi:hypothetical protein